MCVRYQGLKNPASDTLCFKNMLRLTGMVLIVLRTSSLQCVRSAYGIRVLLSTEDKLSCTVP